MSSFIDPESDKVLNIYKQYARLTDAETAGYLTVAHYLAHVVCVMKDVTDHPPKAVRYSSPPNSE